jgi:2-methylcitrate dehydratase PrpD
MALMMSSGRIGRFAGQPTGRWIILNAAFADGVRAYEAGAHGYKGDLGLLDGPWLQNALGYAPQLDALVEGLHGSRAMSGLGMKPVSTARQALAPTQALMELIAEGLAPGDVQSIDVRVPEAYAAMISRPLEPYRSSTYSNAGFQMALAALAPDHLLDLDRAGVIADPAILAFAGKVTVKADASLQSDYPRVWAGEIDVRTARGLLTRKVTAPRGDAANRMSDEEIHAKHTRLLSAAMGQGLGQERAQEALGILRAMFEEPAPAIALMRRAMA